MVRLGSTGSYSRTWSWSLCLAAIDRLAQEPDRGGELSAVGLESDPGGARGGNINLNGGEDRWRIWIHNVKRLGNMPTSDCQRQEEPRRRREQPFIAFSSGPPAQTPMSQGLSAAVWHTDTVVTTNLPFTREKFNETESCDQKLKQEIYKAEPNNLSSFHPHGTTFDKLLIKSVQLLLNSCF